jgi:hypothetical protein
MKKIVFLLTLCLFFAMVANALSADKIIIQFPFAFKDRFQAGSQHLGFPEGTVLQVGGIIKPAGSPIQEVTVKNLDTGLVLTATSQNVGTIWSGLYQVYPMPPFDPSKHMGVWEIRVKDEKGNEVAAKTHKLNIIGEMPYVEDLKASGNPLAPTIMWTALNEKDIPQGCAVRYQVRLLKGDSDQFYKSKALTDTTLQIPEGTIKPEDLSKIYIRVDTQGYDKNDKEHPLPLELKSQTFKPLNEALGKQ